MRVTFKYISIATGSEWSRAVWKGLNLRLGLQIEPRILCPWKLQSLHVECCAPNLFSEALHQIWELKQFFCVKVKYVAVGYSISFFLIYFEIAKFLIVYDLREQIFSECENQ